MSLTPKDIQVTGELANVLYDFLPGKPHPYADSRISFSGVATQLGLASYWIAGSKRPAITQLLIQTLDHKKGQFCPLILALTQAALTYRNGKGHPITREEVDALNEQVRQLGFKIPELWDPAFLEQLPYREPRHNDVTKAVSCDITSDQLTLLQSSFKRVQGLNAHPRGLAFEHFLNEMFFAFGLLPRPSFTLRGEQIDGSFELDHETYLLEAKWHNEPIGQRDVRAFGALVDDRARWSRGLFVSYSGFSEDALDSLRRGGATVIGLNGQDLHFILNGHISLDEALRAKVRWKAETGEFYVPIYNLLR